MIGVPSWTESEETSSSRPEDTECTTKQPEGKPQSFDAAFSSPSPMIMVFGLREPGLEHIICPSGGLRSKTLNTVYRIEFDLVGVDASIANALRRILIAEVQLAIFKPFRRVVEIERRSRQSR